MRRDQTQERATDVGLVKKKDKKRKKERKEEREGRRDQKREFLHRCRTLSWSMPMDWARVDAT